MGNFTLSRSPEVSFAGALYCMRMRNRGFWMRNPARHRIKLHVWRYLTQSVLVLRNLKFQATLETNLALNCSPMEILLDFGTI